MNIYLLCKKYNDKIEIIDIKKGNNTEELYNNVKDFKDDLLIIELNKEIYDQIKNLAEQLNNNYNFDNIMFN